MDQSYIYLSGILTAYGIFIVGMFSPGPNILTILGTSMSVDRESGKALAMGIATGSLLWGVLAWLGLVTLLLAFASLIYVIKLLGAAYLLWLACKAFKSSASVRDIVTRRIDLKGDRLAYFRKGLIIQMTNPKAALTWTATVSLGLSATAPWWVGGVIVLGTTILSFVGHLGYAVAFSAEPMVNAYRKARRRIEFCFGVFFCFASFKLFTSKV
jgi:amino acid exporter